MSIAFYQELKAYYRSMKSELDPMDVRLAKEHLALERLAIRLPFVEITLPEGDIFPPKEYRLVFDPLPGIVAINEDQSPVYGDHHELEIKIPSNFPVESAICSMVTSVWHPNIQSDDGPMQGRICGNTEGFGTFYSLDRMVMRICDMIRYKVYLADFRFPYPEDETVARWVKRYAEPKGIVKKGVGLLKKANPSVAPEQPSEQKKVG